MTFLSVKKRFWLVVGRHSVSNAGGKIVRGPERCRSGGQCSDSMHAGNLAILCKNTFREERAVGGKTGGGMVRKSNRGGKLLSCEDSTQTATGILWKGKGAKGRLRMGGKAQKKLVRLRFLQLEFGMSQFWGKIDFFGGFPARHLSNIRLYYHRLLIQT